MKRIIIIPVILLACNCCAQTADKMVTGANGNTVVRPNVSIDWTIGQTVIGAATLSGYTILEGFHNSTTGSTGLKTLDNNSGIVVYPIPANDKLVIKTVTTLAENTNVYIYDIKGVVIKSLSLKQNLTEINVSLLPAGTYFLSIKNDRETYRNVTILKQ